MGFATSIRYSDDNNLTKYWEIGTRPAVAVMEGIKDVKGSFERAWINSRLLRFSSGTGVLPSFNFLVSGPNGTVYISGLKVGTYDATMPTDGATMETINFVAKQMKMTGIQIKSV